jgi:hypothetical protein
MSTYYDTWKSSEAARDQIFVTLVAWVMIQTLLYPALGKLFPARYLKPISVIYVTLNAMADLAMALATGAAIQ